MQPSIETEILADIKDMRDRSSRCFCTVGHIDHKDIFCVRPGQPGGNSQHDGIKQGSGLNWIMNTRSLSSLSAQEGGAPLLFLVTSGVHVRARKLDQ